MMNQRKPDALDIAVGQRIRVERLSRRMSQTELAEKFGVSFQQVQKYEKGGQPGWCRPAEPHRRSAGDSGAGVLRNERICNSKG